MKKAVINDEKPSNLNRKQERFAELYSKGVSPQEAHLAAGYSPRSATSNPYLLLQKPEIQIRVRELMDKSLTAIVKNDIALAKLKVHKGEHILEGGHEISPSLIEGAKNRVYDRGSLGPVIRKNESVNLNVGINLTSEESAYLDQVLEKHYQKKG